MIFFHHFNLNLFTRKVLLPAFLLLTMIVNGQNDFTSIHYRGIRPDDRNGLIPFRNPGRGFRLEVPVEFSPTGDLFNKGADPVDYLKSEALKYASDSISLVETCLVLPAFEDKPISDAALLRMQVYFDTLRRMGMKTVLRMAYKSDPDGGKGPKQTDMLHHFDQLQPLLFRNRDVILVVIKPDKMNSVLLSGPPFAEQLVRENDSTIVDGALPEGAWSLAKGGFLIDGYKAALRFRLQHFTSFSLIHNNNKEDSDQQKYSMTYWKDVPVDPVQLKADKMPFSEDYFTTASGDIVQLPLFNYIRDHLGYRIELQQLMLPVKRLDNSPIILKLELINRGFSAVKHPCTVAFVLIDPTDKVFELPADANPYSWQPFASGDLNYKPLVHLIQFHGKLPLHLMPGRYKLGLWIADANAGIHYDHRYDIRCANGNMGWWVSRDGRYGINILTNLTISK